MRSESEKTIERLSLYRRRLNSIKAEKEFIYSKELAEIANSNAAQVRRDLMSVGYLGNTRKGYNIRILINNISKYLDPELKENVVIVGTGNLGRALLTFFKNRLRKLCISAVFDIDPDKVGKKFGETECRHTNDLKEFIINNNVKIGVICTNEQSTEDIALTMVSSGIKSIINFSCVPVKEYDGVFIEQIDITASFEKAAFFISR
jgi:redox-sensing transcriptional repressor